MTKPYTRAHLYPEIAKLNRRIRALERDNRLLREAASREGVAVIRAAMNSRVHGWIFNESNVVCNLAAVCRLEDACSCLAAKRKERKARSGNENL